MAPAEASRVRVDLFLRPAVVLDKGGFEPVYGQREQGARGGSRTRGRCDALVTLLALNLGFLGGTLLDEGLLDLARRVHLLTP